MSQSYRNPIVNGIPRERQTWVGVVKVLGLRISLVLISLFDTMSSLFDKKHGSRLLLAVDN